MILTSVALSHFRSYTKEVFSLSPHTTVLVGPNTAGKTNIVEAISLLSTGKSFRAERDSEMIAWDQDVARVTGKTGDTTLDLVLTTGVVQGKKVPHKRYIVNGVPRRQIDFLGHVRAVRFWPEDLSLVIDSQSVRRRYLDSVLVQVDREYRRCLLSYERGVRQRNKVLEQIQEGAASRSQLFFWDQLLIKDGGYITNSRLKFIDFMNTSQPPSEYSVRYDKSIISDSRLEQYATEEVSAKMTLVGPHRDDFSVSLKKSGHERDVATYGSRGEQRMAVLFLKLAEFYYIQTIAQDRPMLLLDDVFSELDEYHRKEVLELVGKQQTLITTAEDAVPTLIKAGLPSSFEVIRVPRV